MLHSPYYRVNLVLDCLRGVANAPLPQLTHSLLVVNVSINCLLLRVDDYCRSQQYNKIDISWLCIPKDVEFYLHGIPHVALWFPDLLSDC